MSTPAQKDIFKSALHHVLRMARPELENGVVEMKKSPAGRAALNVLRQRDKIESAGDAAGLFASEFLNEVEALADADPAAAPPPAKK